MGDARCLAVGADGAAACQRCAEYAGGWEQGQVLLQGALGCVPAATQHCMSEQETRCMGEGVGTRIFGRPDIACDQLVCKALDDVVAALCASMSQQDKPLMHDPGADHGADLCISWRILRVRWRTSHSLLLLLLALVLVASLKLAASAAHARQILRERLPCWQHDLCRPSLHGTLGRAWQQSWLCSQVHQLGGGGRGVC